jgi:hypothetical protein
MPSVTLVVVPSSGTGSKENCTVRIRVDSSSGKLDESSLAGLEERLGYRLPTEYREFLLQHNGGKPEPNILIEADGRARVGVTKFLAGGHADCELLATRLQYRERVPSDLLPVALAEGGNLICLGVFGRRENGVYFWDHEGESGGKKPSNRNISPIAKNFTVFLDDLKLFKPEDVRIDDKAVEEAWIDPEFLNQQKRLGNT